VELIGYKYFEKLENRHYRERKKGKIGGGERMLVVWNRERNVLFDGV